jgi:hypothetical protein
MLAARAEAVLLRDAAGAPAGVVALAALVRA